MDLLLCGDNYFVRIEEITKSQNQKIQRLNTEINQKKNEEVK